MRTAPLRSRLRWFARTSTFLRQYRTFFGSICRVVVNRSMRTYNRIRDTHQNRKPLFNPTPLAYLITYTCYGTRLHGDERGSVDRRHTHPGAPNLPADKERQRKARARMLQPSYKMDPARRNLVLEAILEACQYHSWTPYAVHVRTNHVHCVVHALSIPERVMNTFKARSSSKLNKAGLDPVGRRRWTRHGSTPYLWKEEAVEAAIHYVIYEQGEPMAVYMLEQPSG